MKQKFSTLFFVRSYVAIVLGIFLVALALDAVLALMTKNSEQEALLQQYTPHLEFLSLQLNDNLDATNPIESFNSSISQYTDIFALPVALFQVGDFNDQQDFLAELENNEAIVFYDNQDQAILYQQQQSSPYIIALGPIASTDSPLGNQENLIISAYYALIALLLFLWIKPFYRDLSMLREAATDFGRQDFSTRVEISEKSSILPVAQSFNAMAQRIEDLVSAHQELTNAVSHELRTPLSRFRFSLEILGRTTDEGKKLEYLSNMKKDISELENLIDEMLNYARLNEQNLLLSLTTVDLNALLEDIIAPYFDEAIDIEYIPAQGAKHNNYLTKLNPELFARAIHNILRNCLRYANSKITMQAYMNDDQIRVIICDDGPGIPENMQQKIFEPFSRLDTSRDKKSGGYGLGLAIANKIIQRHQGTIVATNYTSQVNYKLQDPGAKKSDPTSTNSPADSSGNAQTAEWIAAPDKTSGACFILQWRRMLD